MTQVPNAVGGRDNIEVEIFGMEGIPEADRIAHELQKTGKCFSPFPSPPRPLPLSVSSPSSGALQMCSLLRDQVFD